MSSDRICPWLVRQLHGLFFSQEWSRLGGVVRSLFSSCTPTNRLILWEKRNISNEVRLPGVPPPCLQQVFSFVNRLWVSTQHGQKDLVATEEEWERLLQKE